jgi:hypothetical protein
MELTDIAPGVVLLESDVRKLYDEPPLSLSREVRHNWLLLDCGPLLVVACVYVERESDEDFLSAMHCFCVTRHGMKWVCFNSWSVTKSDTLQLVARAT